jgi:3-isopropylmalate/(R)-2-methylmalate dehydratase large subunit
MCWPRRCLVAQEDANMLVEVDGTLPRGVTAKDMVLAVIGRIGTAGGHRPRHRVRRRGHPRAVDGRPHDPLQHGHRGRRARSAWWRWTRPRWPTSRGARTRPPAPTGTRPAPTGAPALRSRRALRPDRHRRGTLEPQVTWGTSPEMVVASTIVVPDPDKGRSGAARRHGARAGLHGPAAEHADRARSRSTRCSSARAPTRASRTCAPPPR